MGLAKGMLIVMVAEGFVDEMRQPFWSNKTHHSHGNHRISCSNGDCTLFGSCNNRNRSNRDHLKADLECIETFIGNAAAAAAHCMTPVPVTVEHAQSHPEGPIKKLYENPENYEIITCPSAALLEELVEVFPYICFSNQLVCHRTCLATFWMLRRGRRPLSEQSKIYANWEGQLPSAFVPDGAFIIQQLSSQIYISQTYHFATNNIICFSPDIMFILYVIDNNLYMVIQKQMI